MSEIGASAESPVPSGEIKAFLEADDAMKQSDAVPER
jgi:hypothetical protein